MEVLMSDLVKEMRLALDEVKHDELNDVFADDSDEEMKQAIETAAQQLLRQAHPRLSTCALWSWSLLPSETVRRTNHFQVLLHG